MNNVEKIINLIKKDKEIANNLFLLSDFREDVTLWTDPPRDGITYENMKWLFVTYQSNHTLIGLNVLDNTIWAIDDEGEFHKACDAVQDLPYEILRLECAFTENETVEDYFEKYKEEGYKKTLERYELWCRNNHIELDKNHIYHDRNRKLFSKSFNKEYEHKHFLLFLLFF